MEKRSEKYDDPASESYIRRQEEDLNNRIPGIMEARKAAGLEGLVGGLEAVIINTEPERLETAVHELLRYTGLDIAETFEDDGFRSFVLHTRGSAAFLVRSRKTRPNPFLEVNDAEKTRHLPNTRLETFVYSAKNLDTYVDIQKSRGVRFMSDEVVEAADYRFIQTPPSPFTGNSLGFIEWRGRKGSFASQGADVQSPVHEKPDLPHLAHIHALDHTATRVRAAERNSAILEFLELTGYHFDFAVYVKILNSITSVARLSRDDYAQVFTSGISPYQDDLTSGPTEKFIHTHGTRVHHMAFRTDKIDATYQALKADGMEFLIGLVGSPEEGLKQIFTLPSPHTLLVNEYIHRYEGFDGFFTRSNVEELTRATEKQ